MWQLRPAFTRPALRTAARCRSTVFYREKAAGAYGVAPYVLAEALVEVPYVIVQATIYSLVVYWWVCVGETRVALRRCLASHLVH